jgi:hypothetical protein
MDSKKQQLLSADVSTAVNATIDKKIPTIRFYSVKYIQNLYFKVTLMENLLKQMNLGFMSVFPCIWFSLMMAHEAIDVGKNM